MAIFSNTRRWSSPPGALSFEFDKTYYPRVLHSAYDLTPMKASYPKITHRHGVFHILMVIKGESVYPIDGVDFPARAGVLFFTSPGQNHSFANCPGENAAYCEVTFQLISRNGKVLRKPIQEVLSNWVGTELAFGTAVSLSAERQSRLAEMYHEFLIIGRKAGKRRDFLLALQLGKILFEIVEQVAGDSDVAKKREPVEMVYQWLHQNFQETTSLDYLAHYAGLSSNYLSRRFKEKYGTTPITYQNKLRIQAASALLQNTQSPIKQIADMVGYNDVYYFTRMFAKIMGMPPGQFRKQELSGE